MPTKRTLGIWGAFVPLVSVFLARPAPAADPPGCFGRPATIIGTSHRDHLKGTRGNDVIVGLGGDDEISGGRGNDLICGGGGYDDIKGRAGNDRVKGGAGIDLTEGGAGNDRIFTGYAHYYRDGPDSAYGGAGNDELHGDRGLNELVGGRGADVIIGKGANFNTCDCDTGFDEVLDGGPGDDRITGGELSGADIENQIFRPGGGDDMVNSGRPEEADGSGGCGQLGTEICPYGYNQLDVIDYADSRHRVVVNLLKGTARGQGADALIGIDEVIGSSYDDRLVGDRTANVLYGGDSFGYDTILGGDGPDWSYVGYGKDSVNGGAGTDYADGGPGEDECVANEEVHRCEGST
jgi:Ca2+-binding RTX toxin-like protein